MTYQGKEITRNLEDELICPICGDGVLYEIYTFNNYNSSDESGIGTGDYECDNCLIQLKGNDKDNNLI
jgi:hypothetical protein